MQGQPVILESVQKLLRRNADRNLAKILERTRPQDIAQLLRHFPGKDGVRIFKLIHDLEHQAEVLAESDPEIQTTIVDALSDVELAELLKQMSGDDAADVIERLPEDRATLILSVWKDEEGREVDSLLAYGPDTAGGIMSPHVFALPEETTCREAIATLQERHEELEMTFYLYVVNQHGTLVGVCSLRQLVIHDPNTALHDIMAADVLSVDVLTDQEEVARRVTRYNLLAIPVVDRSNRLVGIVTVDDVIDVIREEATEDILMMAGAGSADLTDVQNPFRNFTVRMPWLLASFVGGIGSMFIIGAYESALDRVAALAAFIPITIGMGGNVGTQAATIVTRGLALGSIPISQFYTVVGREILTGTLLGLTYGLLLSVVAMVRYSGLDHPGFETWQLALTVALSVAACMTIAATVGGGVPMLLQRAGIDPAVATGPFVTTAVDIIGILAYFLIARMLLGI